MQPADDFTILRTDAEGKEVIYMLVSGSSDAASWIQDLRRDQPRHTFRGRRTTAADYAATGCSPTADQVKPVKP